MRMATFNYATQILGYIATTPFSPKMGIFSIKPLLEAYKNARTNRRDLLNIQTKRLKHLISHAYYRVPYYHRLYKKTNFFPNDITSVEDLKKLPIVTKEMMKDMQIANIKELLAKNINSSSLEKNQTSGSTGIPIKIFYTHDDSRKLGYVGCRYLLENGMNRFDRHVRIVHPSIFHPQSPLLSMLGVSKHCLHGCMQYDISVLANHRKVPLALAQLKPHVIEGYTSTLKMLAVAKKELDVRNIHPKFMISYAEVLDPSTRHFIESAFDTDLIDMYGAHECRTIAWECREHMGYHINADALVLEFLKDGEQVNPGERGKVVITNLFSYAMPFIRYELGDIAIPLDECCSCGCTLPMLEIVEGKMLDFIVLPNGNVISPHILKKELGLRPEIRMFKVVQKDHYNIEVFLVKGPDFSEDVTKSLKFGLYRILGKEANISISYVDEIPMTPGGKFKVIESMVPPKF